MQKKVFYTEAAYFVGTLLIALGTCLMEKADFGVSMVVAPAYIFYLKLSETFSFVTFGMMEYTLQACLLAAMMLVLRRFRVSYLFSFVTAVFYGFVLDGLMAIFRLIPDGILALNLVFFVLGMGVCSLGVSFMFHTYISQAAYELFVKEVSSAFGRDIHKFKTCYDCVSCVVAVGLSFLFFGFGHFEGVKFGTVICALLNGFLIGRCTHMLDSRFAFQDGLSLRRFFVPAEKQPRSGC